MKKVTQTFTKGINKRFDRSQSAPDRFDTLQNARIFKRGDTLDVSRIQGYEKFPILERVAALAGLARPSQYNTDDFQKGYLEEFVDGVWVFDTPSNIGNLRDVMVAGEVFLVAKKVPNEFSLEFTEQVTTGDRLRRPRIAPVLQFVDGVEIGADNLNNNIFNRLSFVEGVDIRDTPLCE